MSVEMPHFGNNFALEGSRSSMQAEPSAVASGKLLAELDLQKNMELTDEGVREGTVVTALIVGPISHWLLPYWKIFDAWLFPARSHRAPCTGM